MTWPTRGQRAPEYWNVQLRDYIDSGDSASGEATTELDERVTAVESDIDGRLSESELADATNVEIVAALAPIDGFNGRLAASRRGPVKIVMLGSSTTEGVGATSPRFRWVNQFATALQAAYPSGVECWEPPVPTLAAASAAVPTLPGVHVINGGVSGSVSATYCGATAQGQIDTVNPSVVVHMIGSNDHATNVVPATYQNNVQTAIDALDALVPDLIHVVCDTYARPDISAPTYPWADYITAMEALASANANVVFVSQVAEWIAAGASGYDPVDSYQLTGWRIGAGGGIHPSDAGHGLLAALVAKGLRIPPPRPVPRAEVFDRFQRAALGSTETSQPWEQQSGVAVPSGGGLTVTTGGNTVVNTGFSDCSVSALITHSSAVVPGVFCKSTDTNTRIGAFLNGPSNRVEIYVGTTIQGFSTGVSLVSGREYFLRLTVSGNQAVAELNGVVVLTVTLSGGDVTTYAAYSKHGVRCSVANAGVKWRNFAVRAL